MKEHFMIGVDYNYMIYILFVLIDLIINDWFGLQLYDLYFICTDRFNNKRKLNSFLEEVTDSLITDENYNIELKRVQNYLFELFPIFETLLKIDNKLSEEDIKIILNGYTPVYRGIRIDKLDCEMGLKI